MYLDINFIYNRLTKLFNYIDFLRIFLQGSARPVWAAPSPAATTAPRRSHAPRGARRRPRPPGTPKRDLGTAPDGAGAAPRWEGPLQGGKP